MFPEILFPVHYIVFPHQVADCDIDEMFTMADADCDGRIRTLVLGDS